MDSINNPSVIENELKHGLHVWQVIYQHPNTPHILSTLKATQWLMSIFYADLYSI